MNTGPGSSKLYAQYERSVTVFMASKVLFEPEMLMFSFVWYHYLNCMLILKVDIVVSQ